MSPEAQRIAIAVACGWTLVDPEWRHWSNGPECRNEDDLPDYLNSRDAMARAIKSLTRVQQAKYAAALQEIGGGCIVGYVPGNYHDDLRSLFRLLVAEPSLQSEAFLRAIGKWDDAK